MQLRNATRAGRAHRPARPAANASIRNPMRTTLTRPMRIALRGLPASRRRRGARERAVPPPAGPRGARRLRRRPPPAAAPGPSAPPLPGEKEALHECKKYPPNKKFKWELRGEVDLMALVNSIAPMLCRPIIVPGNIRQSKVTILAPDTVTAPEAYRMFLSALESMGLTVQPEGKVLKIIESNRARESAIPIYGGDDNPPTQDQFVTQLMRLEHVSPDDVKPVLDRLKGHDGDITSYAPTNTLVITDLASNIRRMEEVVKQLDVPMGGEKIWVIQLHTVVGDARWRRCCESIFSVAKGGRRRRRAAHRRPDRAGAPAAGGGRAPRPPGSICRSRRSSPTIARTSSSSSRRRTPISSILALVKRLDQKSMRAGDVATDLRARDAAGERQRRGHRRHARRSRRGGEPRLVGSSAAGRPAATPSPRRRAGKQDGLFEGDVRIASDKPTNSLVIVASGRDYITVRDLIKKLDIPRRQVFVEATILEVSVDKSRKLGVAWHGGSTLSTPAATSRCCSAARSLVRRQLDPLLPGGAVGPGRRPARSGHPRRRHDPRLAAGHVGAELRRVRAGAAEQRRRQRRVDAAHPHHRQREGDHPGRPEPAVPRLARRLPGTAGVPGAAGGGGLPARASASARRCSARTSRSSSRSRRTSTIPTSCDWRSTTSSPTSRTRTSTASARRPPSARSSRWSPCATSRPIVLGGLIKDSVSETVNKVPLLGDIPILGYLFKSDRARPSPSRTCSSSSRPTSSRTRTICGASSSASCASGASSWSATPRSATSSDYEAEVDYRPQARPARGDQPHGDGGRGRGDELRNAEQLLGRDPSGEVTLDAPPPAPCCADPPSVGRAAPPARRRRRSADAAGRGTR